MRTYSSPYDTFNKSIVCVIGASVLALTQAQAFSRHSGCSNSIYTIDQMSRVTGSNIRIKYNTRQSQLSVIKKYFHLNDQELADTIGVSRKTLYNWQIKGINKEKDRQRVFELSVIAEDWNYNQLHTTKEKLSKAVLGSTSVMQLLMNEELDKEKIIFAGRRLAHQSLNPDTSLI